MLKALPQRWSLTALKTASDGMRTNGPGAPALDVGFFAADGLGIEVGLPADVDGWRGAACFWNFGARQLDSW